MRFDACQWYGKDRSLDTGVAVKIRNTGRQNRSAILDVGLRQRILNTVFTYGNTVFTYGFSCLWQVKAMFLGRLIRQGTLGL